MRSVFSIFTALLLVNCSAEKEAPLSIATAANMQFAMLEMAEAFTEKYGIACDLIVGSSGKLTAQIKEGAPYDVFVAADMKYPNALQASDLTLGSPKIYAYGKLVLWNAQNKEAINLADLTRTDMKHIALANPKTAPYGVAAMQVLKQHDLLDGVQDKLVYGESIAQTNQFILSGAADIGFTALSVVQSPNMQGRGIWIALDEADYDPIAQGVVVINRKEVDASKALQFQAFLFSEEARQILLNFGYSFDE